MLWTSYRIYIWILKAFMNHPNFQPTLEIELTTISMLIFCVRGVVPMKPPTEAKSLLKTIQRLTKREARVLSSMAKKMAVSLRVSERASVLLNKIPTMQMKKLYWLVQKTFRSSSSSRQQKQPWSSSSSRRQGPRGRKGQHKRRRPPGKLEEEEEEEEDDISTYSHSDEFIAHNSDILKKLLLQQLEDAKYLEHNEKLLDKFRSSPTSESSTLLTATPLDLTVCLFILL